MPGLSLAALSIRRTCFMEVGTNGTPQSMAQLVGKTSAKNKMSSSTEKVLNGLRKSSIVNLQDEKLQGRIQETPTMIQAVLTIAMIVIGVPYILNALHACFSLKATKNSRTNKPQS
jgi:ABC-type bacteriocin/lantibiotic exporter with double-glycine peptidase domain